MYGQNSNRKESEFASTTVGPRTRIKARDESRGVGVRGKGRG